MALSFLRRTEPPRTRTSHLNPVASPDVTNSEFIIHYDHTPEQGHYSHTQSFGAPTKAAPPPHYHLVQSETFTVLKGSGLWYRWGAKPIRLSKGDVITIPARAWHRFECTPDPSEALEVQVSYDREAAEREERFFRNLQSYIGDCYRNGQEMSVWQLMVWTMWFGMSIDVTDGLFVSLGPLGEFANFMLSVLVTWSMGIWGEYVLGYERSYEEYYLEKGKKKA
jgi:quercetin dioxygenase-like cupin family protein